MTIVAADSFSDRRMLSGFVAEKLDAPAAHTARYRPVWARATDDARILLREKRLSELQRVALRRDLNRIDSVLDGITKPANLAPPARSSRI